MHYLNNNYYYFKLQNLICGKLKIQLEDVLQADVIIGLFMMVH